MEQNTSGSTAKMNSNKIVMWIIGIVIVVVLIWIISSFAGHNASTSTDTSNMTGTVTSTGFTSQVPNNVALSAPSASSTIINAQTNQTGSMKIFNIKAENGTFTPNEIVIQKGDQVQLSFTGTDGTYDFMFTSPKIGFYIEVKKGETKNFGFDSGSKDAGVYDFGCLHYCGPSASSNASSTQPTILGKMIIK